MAAHKDAIMIQTVLTFLVFTLASVWYIGRQAPAIGAPSRALLLTPRLYAGLFALALLLVLLWR